MLRPSKRARRWSAMFTHLVLFTRAISRRGEGAQRCRVETHTDGWLPADRRQERLVQWRTSRDISRQSLP